MKQKKENKQKRKKKYPIFSFKYLLFDFVKITGAIPTLIYFRPKIYRYGKKEKVKGETGKFFLPFGLFGTLVCVALLLGNLLV